MPAVPSLSSAFSALKTSVPQTTPINWGAINMSTPSAPKASPTSSAPPPQFGFGKPAIPSLNTSMGGVSTPATATPINYGAIAASKPAIPQVGNLQSNDTALRPGQFGAGPFATVKPDGTSTPSAYSQMPAIPTISSAPTAAPKPTPQFSPMVTTPSGATVDPNTGSVVSPATTQTDAVAGPNTGNATGAAGYSYAAGGAPATPDLYGGYGTGTSPADLFSRYLSSLTPSQAESDAIKKLTDLNTSASEAYTNIENQPIALPFITGQQAAVQRSQTLLATPLQQQIALLQAQRQMQTQGLSSLLDFTKPVSTSYGGTLSRYNPATGQYDTVVNPFGTATGTATGTGTNVQDVIGQAIADGRLSADQVTRYGIPFIASTLQNDPGYNFITQKASVASDSASLKTQQAYADTVSRAFDTANANLSQLVQFMQTSGVNSGSVPIVNTLQNKVKAGLTDPGTIAAFQAALAGLRAEYAQVLSRGGEVTDGQRNAAATLIPDNLSPDQLQQVTDRLKIEGNNAITEANQKVKDIQTRLKSNPGGSSGSSSSSNGAFSNKSSSQSSSGSGSIWDF